MLCQCNFSICFNVKNTSYNNFCMKFWYGTSPTSKKKRISMECLLCLRITMFWQFSRFESRFRFVDALMTSFWRLCFLKQKTWKYKQFYWIIHVCNNFDTHFCEDLYWVSDVSSLLLIKLFIWEDFKNTWNIILHYSMMKRSHPIRSE